MMFLWFFTGISGHSAAYRKYREIIRYLSEIAETPEEKEEYAKSLAKSDAELRDEAIAGAKWR